MGDVRSKERGPELFCMDRVPKSSKEGPNIVEKSSFLFGYRISRTVEGNAFASNVPLTEVSSSVALICKDPLALAVSVAVFAKKDRGDLGIFSKEICVWNKETFSLCSFLEKEIFSLLIKSFPVNCI